MNAFMESVRNTQAPEGTAVLWWLGQMSLLVKMGDTVLSVDYYAADDPDRLVRPPVPIGEVTGVDAFLGTHDHIDHIDHTAWKVWAKTCPGASFVFPDMHRESVLADGVAPEKAIGLQGFDSCRIGNVTVRCVPAAHEFLDRDPATGRYPHLQYILEGNGLRIWHAGDTVRYEGMLPQLRALGPIDAALMPINGRDGKRYRANFIGNMTFQEAADLAGELRVGLAIPGHWDMFAANPGDPEAFADYLDAKYEGKVPSRIPRYLEPIVLTAR
ncbi:MAG: MBL fold metallo-hydrolase [Clostridia bacterium]|nr:MBL fold metallo-hydrolase [Clostridia bacterium]